MTKKRSKAVIFILLIIVVVFIVWKNSKKEYNKSVLQNPDEFYEVVTNQISKGQYQKEYKVSFNPEDINPEEIMRVAYEKGGYELLAKFTDWSYLYEPVDSGYVITMRTGFIYSAFQEKRINILAFLMAMYCRDKTDYEKIKFVYDYLITNCEYDISGSGIYNALFKKQCCCNGYAGAFLRLMNEMDIPCKFTVGSNHAWNTVYLEGEWYNLDSTWGDRGRDNIDYTYFLKSNADWQGLREPEATAKTSYPAENLTDRSKYPNFVLITNIIFAFYVMLPFIILFLLIKFLRYWDDRKILKRIAENEKNMNMRYHVD